MSDFLTRLQNTEGRAPGASYDPFKPGHIIEKVTAIQTSTPKGTACFDVRFGDGGKRWIDFSCVWGPNPAGAAKKANEPMSDEWVAKENARFETEFKGRLDCLAVKKGDGTYGAFLDYVAMLVESGQVDGSTLTPEVIFGDIAGACVEAGNLYTMTVNRARYEKITKAHVDEAKRAKKKDLSLYYNGRTGMVPFSQWEEKKGLIPAPKKQPESFGAIDQRVQKKAAGASKPAAKTSEPPAMTDQSVPF